MKTVVAALVAVWLGGSWALAQTVESPAPEVVARLNQLEAETQSLRAEVERLRERPVRLPAVSGMTMGGGEGSSSPSAEGDAQPTVEELRGEMQRMAWRKGDFSITPYGILWGNSVYATQRTSPGSYTLFAQSGSTGQESEFLVDGRNTRLGLDVLGPQIAWLDDAQTGGKVEIDFQNNSLNVLSGENKSSVLLRHAYLETKSDECRLLAGQTWDVISPLNPGMLLYSVGWCGGNIGYRRAQLRGERYWSCSDASLLTAQFCMASQAFVDNITTKTPAGTLSGEPSNWPILEGRTAWTIGDRGPDGLPITVGVSGHIGQQGFNYTYVDGGKTVTDSDNRCRTWSGNLDIRIPITHRLGLQGEFYVGENLGTFLGGIGQGVDPIGLNPIRDAGGWFEVWYDWTPTLHSHVGYSVDDPNDHDIHYYAGKTYNQFYYGNMIFDVTKNFQVGLEVSSWRTLYRDQLPGDSVRTEFVAKYGF
ncbi:MAG: hypothetical protein LLF97_08560 [Planctomycetaceae bacterium]|nr:hypothetical protein [Planctomycetaceae bacterium]